jgi:DNA-binding transcriptional MerR regulator
MDYSVGAVSRLTGVTVRALHHYDEIGLLTPTARTSAGYRRYSLADLQRLHRILTYRQLGFALPEIAVLLDESTDLTEHLRRQHVLLTERIDRLTKTAANITHVLEAYMAGIDLTPEEIFEVFGSSDPTVYDDEAATRWGETAQYQQSRRRTSTYGKEQWAQIKAEGDDIQQHLGTVFRSGATAQTTEAMDAVEAHRAYVTRWFYDLSPQMHRQLGEMYVSDPRFTATYEAIAPGLAAWVHAAIDANAQRLAS